MRAASVLATLALLLPAGGALAAEIYVLDVVMEREGVESISPTFIVTPGERALLAFDGENEVDVAMTLTPRAGAGTGGTEADDGAETGDGAEAVAGTGNGADGTGEEAFDLRIELVDGVEVSQTTVPVSLSETETVELGGQTIKVLVSVQEPLGETAPAAEDGGG